MRGSAREAESKNCGAPLNRGAENRGPNLRKNSLLPNAPGFNWPDGYSAFSVSASQVPNVRRYMENQAAHRRVSAREELVQLLRLHHVAVDE